MSEAAVHHESEPVTADRSEDREAVHGSVRSCVGCGERVDVAGNHALVRLIISPEGEVAVDARGGGFGRGAHVHPRPECLQKAVDRGLARSAKAKINTLATESGSSSRSPAPRSPRRSSARPIAASRAAPLGQALAQARDRGRRGPRRLGSRRRALDPGRPRRRRSRRADRGSPGRRRGPRRRVGRQGPHRHAGARAGAHRGPPRRGRRHRRLVANDRRRAPRSRPRHRRRDRRARESGDASRVEARGISPPIQLFRRVSSGGRAGRRSTPAGRPFCRECLRSGPGRRKTPSPHRDHGLFARTAGFSCALRRSR